MSRAARRAVIAALTRCPPLCATTGNGRLRHRTHSETTRTTSGNCSRPRFGTVRPAPTSAGCARPASPTTRRLSRSTSRRYRECPSRNCASWPPATTATAATTSSSFARLTPARRLLFEKLRSVGLREEFGITQPGLGFGRQVQQAGWSGRSAGSDRGFGELGCLQAGSGQGIDEAPEEQCGPQRVRSGADVQDPGSATALQPERRSDGVPDLGSVLLRPPIASGRGCE